MPLHTLSRSPEHPAFNECVALLTADDALLLMGDGVYGAIANTPAAEALANTGATVHVLDSDAAAAGITSISPTVKIVCMADFVGLTEQYARQVAWY